MMGIIIMEMDALLHVPKRKIITVVEAIQLVVITVGGHIIGDLPYSL